MELAPPPVAYAASPAFIGCQPVNPELFVVPSATKFTAPTAVFQGVDASPFTPQPLLTPTAASPPPNPAASAKPPRRCRLIPKCPRSPPQPPADRAPHRRPD